MDAIRILKKVTDDRIEELNRYKGKNVEIIILPEITENKEINNDSILSLRGCLKTKIDGMEFQRQMRKEWERE